MQPLAHYILLLATFFSLSSCQSSNAKADAPSVSEDVGNTEIGTIEELERTDYFLGSIIYTASAEGSNTEGVEMFQDLAASEIEVTFGAMHYRQEEKDGMNAGVIIADLDSNKAIYLDTDERTWERAGFTDLGNLDPEVRAFMAKTFDYKLEATGETETIQGYETQKHKVLQSGFIKDGAEVHVWIAKDLNLRPTQYDFETEWKRITAPLPLSYGFSEGAVLRSVTSEDEVIVSYEVTSIVEGTPDQSLFRVPSNYDQRSE